MKKRPIWIWLLVFSLILSACSATNATEENASAGENSANSNQNTSNDADANESSTDSELPEEMPLLLASFSTTDLEGNPIDQSILEDYKLTMVNVWATFCGPCLNEMPDLGALAKEYEDQGVQFVGLVSDVLNSDGSISESQVTTAQDIVEETGADYLHLLPSEDLLGLLSQIYAVPTTFFVDSEGRQVGYAYVQALSKDQWITAIDEALAKVEVDE